MSSGEYTELLSVTEISDLVSVSESTIRRFIKDGLPVAKLSPRVVRVRASDLEEWLASRVQVTNEVKAS
jgi:excisionase family DNA binding protein